MFAGFLNDLNQRAALRSQTDSLGNQFGEQVPAFHEGVHAKPSRCESVATNDSKKRRSFASPVATSIPCGWRSVRNIFPNTTKRAFRSQDKNASELQLTLSIADLKA